MPRAPRAETVAAGPASPVAKKKAPPPKSIDPNAPQKEKRSRGKDGCLTCRMRRKKCETERGPDGACKTCTRLSLECLGWGAKRPDWMRDKDLVEQKLSEIKDQLTAQGLVRGVTKSGEKSSEDRSERRARKSATAVAVAAIPTTSSTKTRTIAPYEPVVVPPAAPLSHPAPARSNPQYPTSRHHTQSPAIPPASIPPPASRTLSTSEEDSDSSEEISPTSSQPGPSEAVVSDMSLSVFSYENVGPVFSDTTLDQLTIGQDSAAYDSTTLVPFISHELVLQGDFYDPQPDYLLEMTNRYDTFIAYGLDPPHAMEMIMRSYDPALPLGPTPPIIPYSPRIRNLVPPFVSATPNQEDLIFYYFSRVSSMQYVFDQTSTNTMHSLISRNPSGPVATAIIALSALHDARMRAAEGLDTGHLRTANSHQLYFDKAQHQLTQTIYSGRSLTEAEATAALHLVSWWLFQGGDGQWADALKIASDWYERESGVFNGDPFVALHKLKPEGQFAAKTTMWMDIFSSITLLRPPRFSSLYQHLLKYYSAQSGIFGSTNGCCDAVMFILASIVDLEYTKSQDAARNMEDYERDLLDAELICRVRALREDLIAVDCDAQPQIVEIADGSPSMQTTASNLTSDIFRQGALLYLSTVENGYSPSVSHTKVAVASTKTALEALPPSPVDRSLVFPICLAGCMTDDPVQRTFFSTRLSALGGPIGNCMRALNLMEEVWRQRDATGISVGWREVMKDMKVELLLV